MSTPAPQAEIESEYCYRHPDRQSFIHCQRCGRTICPQCQTQAAVGVQCPECVREGRQQLAASRPSLLARFTGTGSTPVVTYVLIGLCVVLYVIQLLSANALTEAWFLDPSAIRSEPWRLVTSMFLHSTGSLLFLHLLFNMYALFIFGPALERFLGRIRFLALYLVGGFGGSVGVVLVYQAYLVSNGASAKVLGGFFSPAAALGASGAIFALMGALLVLHRAMGLQLRQIVIVIAVNIGFSIYAHTQIAWEAHLGGLAIGAAIGGVLLATRRPQQRSTQVLGIAGIAAALVLIVVISVVSQPSGYR